MTLYRISSNVFDYILTDVSLTKEPKYLYTGTLNILISRAIITPTFSIFTNYPIYNNFENVHSQFNTDIVESFHDNPQTMFESLMNPEFVEILNINETQDAIIYSFNITISGVFKIFYSLDGNMNFSKAIGCASFVVLPNIFVGQYKYLNIDNIIMQTVISKLLGPIDEWLDRIKVANSIKYNCIHFTPIQHISNSAYAIIDHTMLNKTFNVGPNKPCLLKDVKALIEVLDVQMGMLCISDIVLNHMVPDGPFLKTNPNCAYNLKNCPHLIPAYILDQTVQIMSREIEDGKWEYRGIKKFINNENDLYSIRVELWQKVKELNLEDFFLVTISDQLINDIIKEFEFIKNKITFDDEVYLNLNEFSSSFTPPMVIIIDNYAHRKMTTVNSKSIAYILNKTHSYSDVNRDIVFEFLLELNKNIQQELRQNLDVAMGNIMDGIRHRFVDPNGLHLGNVSLQNPLVDRYFYTSNQVFESIEVAEKFIELHADKCLLHNGWMMQQDNPLIDPAGPFSQAYFKREIIPWTDTVKLYYGSSPQDNLILWNYMADYCKQTVSIFKGVRIDNCHNTPLHVLKYFIAIMRKVRSDLLLVAELFTCDKKYDDIYIMELGIHLLLTDVSAPNHSQHLMATINKFLTPPGFTNFIPRIHQLFINSELLIQDYFHFTQNLQLKDNPNDYNYPKARMNDVSNDSDNKVISKDNTTKDGVNINEVTNMMKNDVTNMKLLLMKNDVIKDQIIVNKDTLSEESINDYNDDYKKINTYDDNINYLQRSSNIKLICDEIFSYLNETQAPINKLDEDSFSINKAIENVISIKKISKENIYNMMDDQVSINVRPRNINKMSVKFLCCRYLIFDQNHDNCSLVEEKGCGWMLGMACLTCLLPGPIGSSRGCDELVPHKICVVYETRLYKKNNCIKNIKENSNQTEDNQIQTDQLRHSFFESNKNVIGNKNITNNLKEDIDDNLLTKNNYELNKLNGLEYYKENSSCFENETISNQLNSQYVDLDTGIFKIRSLFNQIHTCLNKYAFTECQIVSYHNIISIERWQVHENELFDKIYSDKIIKIPHPYKTSNKQFDSETIGKLDISEIMNNKNDNNKFNISFNIDSKANFFVFIVVLNNLSASFELRCANIVEILLKFDVKDNKFANEEFIKNDVFINGLEGISANLESLCNVNSEFIIKDCGGFYKIEVLNPMVGTGYFMRCKLNDVTISLLEEIEDVFFKFDSKYGNDKFSNIFKTLSKDDIDYVLYGDDKNGLYHIPNFGNLMFCGFVGVYLAYIDMIQNNDVINHPLYKNMLDGDWLMDYCCNRLDLRESLRDMSNLMKIMFDKFKRLPKSFSIQYFCSYVDTIYCISFENGYLKS